MNVSEIKQVLDLGLGPIAFIALLYGGWQLLTWLKIIATNHLAHVQAALERIVESSDKANENIEKILAKLNT